MSFMSHRGCVSWLNVEISNQRMEAELTPLSLHPLGVIPTCLGRNDPFVIGHGTKKKNRLACSLSAPVFAAAVFGQDIGALITLYFNRYY